MGQPEALGLLQRALETGRIAHAYLFAGPDGVGKKTLALCLARALNCLDLDNKPGSFAPCGRCLSCRKIACGNHPDVKVVSPDGVSVRIDQIREIKKEMSYRPYEGRYRVWILEDCDKMTEQAANSTLKVLEEPQERSVFILLTSNVLSLLPTIVSRCQVVRFNPVGAAVISGLLRERYAIPAEKARLLAFLCHGSVGKAVGWATGRIPMPPRDEVIALVGGFLSPLGPGSKPGAILRAAEALEKRKDDLDEILDLLEDWYRDLMIVCEAAHHHETGHGATHEREADELSKALVVNLDKLETLEEQARVCSTERAAKSIGVIEATRQSIRRNANVRLALENMLFTLFPGV